MRCSTWLIAAFIGIGCGSSYGVTSAAEIAPATSINYASTINHAGRQRMLSQKMSKEILLIASNIDVGKNKEELSKSAAIFDRALNGLIDGNKGLELSPARNQLIVEQLNKVKSLWGNFKVFVEEVVATGQASEEIIKKASDLNRPLLEEADKVVIMYVAEAEYLTDGEEGAHVIDLAGMQRMLTQKMAKEFLLLTLNVNVGENELMLRDTVELFEQTLNSLIEGDKYLKLPPTTNKTIIQQLSKVQLHWKDFKEPFVTAIGASKWSQDSIRKIADLSLPPLLEMDKAVGMYEEEYRDSLTKQREAWLAY